MSNSQIEAVFTVRVPDRVSHKEFAPYVAKRLRQYEFALTDPEPLSFVFSRFTGTDWFVTVRGKVPRLQLEEVANDEAVSEIMSLEGEPLFQMDAEPYAVVIDAEVPIGEVSALAILHAVAAPFADIRRAVVDRFLRRFRP
jgi:hypothetical protein